MPAAYIRLQYRLLIGLGVYRSYRGYRGVAVPAANWLRSLQEVRWIFSPRVWVNWDKMRRILDVGGLVRMAHHTNVVSHPIAGRLTPHQRNHVWGCWGKPPLLNLGSFDQVFCHTVPNLFCRRYVLSKMPHTSETRFFPWGAQPCCIPTIDG